MRCRKKANENARLVTAERNQNDSGQRRINRTTDGGSVNKARASVPTIHMFVALMVILFMPLMNPYCCRSEIEIIS